MSPPGSDAVPSVGDGPLGRVSTWPAGAREGRGEEPPGLGRQAHTP